MFGFNPANRKRLLTLAGFPVSATVSVAFLLVLILLLYGQGGPQQMLTAIFVVISLLVGVLLHELGHALMIRRLGYGSSEIILTGLGGLTVWRGAPTPRHGMAIAVAGPVVSLLLAALGLGLFFGMQAAEIHLPVLRSFLLVFGGLNLLWGVFNLLPVHPMDGGKIVRSWLRQRRSQRESTRISLKLSFLFGGVLLAASVMLNQIFIALLMALLLLQNWNEWQTVR